MNRLRAVLPAVLATVALTTAACGSSAATEAQADPGATTDTPLELSIDGGDAMASCIPFDVTILADMSPALAGTVTDIEGETITLDVDRWYAGGDSSTVALNATSGMEALIGGLDFEVGKQYLITASQGNVNFCGYSGAATPELTAAFDEAFPQ